MSPDKNSTDRTAQFIEAAESDTYSLPHPLLDAMRPATEFHYKPLGEDDFVANSEISDEHLLTLILATVKNGGDFEVSEGFIEYNISDSQKFLGELPLDSLEGNIESDWKSLRRITRTPKDQVNWLHLACAGLIAAEYLPNAGYRGGKIDRPRDGRESLSQKTFRNSINFLQAYWHINNLYAASSRLQAIAEKEGFNFLTETGQAAQLTTQQQEVIDRKLFENKALYRRLDLHDFAAGVLGVLQNSSPEQINNELNEVYRHIRHLMRLDIDMDETGWTILPEEEWGVSGSGNSAKEESEESEESEKYKFVDWSRIERLRRYVHDYPGAYLAVANLGEQGEEEYYVAALPAKIGGLAVEHAIADNPTSGNAVYAWRAEKGMDSSGVAMTWRGVFKHTKRVARILGARRMLHVETLEENVRDYLSRPVSELNKPGYNTASKNSVN